MFTESTGLSHPALTDRRLDRTITVMDPLQFDAIANHADPWEFGPGEFAPVIDELGHREYCLGLSPAGELVIGQADPDALPSVPGIIVQDGAGQSELTPARRAVNFFCAQLLQRGAPVFAEPDLLPYCRGGADRPRPRPPIDFVEWQANSPDPAMAVVVGRTQSVWEQIELPSDRLVTIFYSDERGFNYDVGAGPVTNVLRSHPILPGFVSVDETNNPPLRIGSTFRPPLRA